MRGQGRRRRGDGPRRPAAAHRPTPTIIASALQSRPHAAHSAEAVLDKLNRGVVIFDDEARVRFANDAALRSRPTAGLAIAEGRFFRDPALQARFEAFLQRGRERADGGEEQSPVAMRVDTADGRAPLRVLLSPLVLPSDRIAGHREPQYVLMIYEPHAGRHVPKRILHELYGLSDAEADLSCACSRASRSRPPRGACTSRSTPPRPTCTTCSASATSIRRASCCSCCRSDRGPPERAGPVLRRAVR